MNKLIDQISAVLAEGFAAAGYDPALGRAVVSNRPDLCQYQCNGAMGGAKLYHKAPFMIADDVVAAIGNNPMFSKLETVRPGYINLDLSPEFLAQRMAEIGRSHAGSGEGGASPDHCGRLRRTQRGKAFACGASALCHHR